MSWARGEILQQCKSLNAVQRATFLLQVELFFFSFPAPLPIPTIIVSSCEWHVAEEKVWGGARIHSSKLQFNLFCRINTFPRARFVPSTKFSGEVTASKGKECSAKVWDRFRPSPPAQEKPATELKWWWIKFCLTFSLDDCMLGCRGLKKWEGGLFKIQFSNCFSCSFWNFLLWLAAATARLLKASVDDKVFIYPFDKFVDSFRFILFLVLLALFTEN